MLLGTYLDTCLCSMVSWPMFHVHALQYLNSLSVLSVDCWPMFHVQALQYLIVCMFFLLIVEYIIWLNQSVPFRTVISLSQPFKQGGSSIWAAGAVKDSLFICWGICCGQHQSMMFTLCKITQLCIGHHYCGEAKKYSMWPSQLLQPGKAQDCCLSHSPECR